MRLQHSPQSGVAVLRHALLHASVPHLSVPLALAAAVLAQEMGRKRLQDFAWGPVKPTVGGHLHECLVVRPFVVVVEVVRSLSGDQKGFYRGNSC